MWFGPPESAVACLLHYPRRRGWCRGGRNFSSATFFFSCRRLRGVVAYDYSAGERVVPLMGDSEDPPPAEFFCAPTPSLANVTPAAHRRALPFPRRKCTG